LEGTNNLAYLVNLKVTKKIKCCEYTTQAGSCPSLTKHTCAHNQGASTKNLRVVNTFVAQKHKNSVVTSVSSNLV